MKMDKSLGLKVAAIRAAIAAPAAGWVSVQVRIGRLCLSYSEGFHKEEMQTEFQQLQIRDKMRLGFLIQRFVKHQRCGMITVNPAMVIGSLLTANTEY
ncbi:hypothetical protein F0562_007626 [Nyssa sinensis]|uniref:Uncharacterized protein n=1 Tax=Nyssa sinensis TaxID=561372 RepID=A0A5J5A8U2_9ASTE|nr:hypothetical protein F0562_017662 [Nyssa sinensis]KAA8525771.1 hypothetical protein F0562_007626 [Nyssa sinensis]